MTRSDKISAELLALRSSVKTEARVKAGDTVRVLRCQNVYGEDVYSFSSKPFQPGETFVVGHVETDSAFSRNIVFPVGEMDFWPEEELLSAIEAPAAEGDENDNKLWRAGTAMKGTDPGLIHPDDKGHRTRFSDSSFHDEVCVLCGATDGRGDNRLERQCPKALTAGLKGDR